MISASTANVSFYPVNQKSNSICLDLESTFAEWSEITKIAIVQCFRKAEGFNESLIPVAARLEEAKSARHNIEELACLKENWDGYGASAISQRARDNALYFISLIEAAPYGAPIPEISPTPNGTISFEWETPHAEAYLEIGNTRYSGFITTGQQQSALFEGQADSLDQQIIALVQRAMSLAPAHPASITEIYTQTPKHEHLAP